MQNHDDMDAAHDHVSLLAGHGGSGQPVREVVPATALGGGRYRITGSPGFVEGCAEGDIVQCNEDGSFHVVERGPNVCVQIYAEATFPGGVIDDLRAHFRPLGGLIEGPPAGRFLVVTVPAASGFPAIKTAMSHCFSALDGVEWQYGNVYGPNGGPLNWWL
ncbi:DUF4265 domain-containing protein [Actinacidiphila acidipaludis]|uniref:DUF4265 domain-containing protein n=1 Tax=Actinacidiphila acidipaludis TaxID=2873382 RepID=A0ABS7Q7T9_9ACTN|nr:DUF4265 domain-containing protein [Streptomyces acidipaludis]MBY8879208.1 DUF4265 domain-containing protein [Streptomyces acidipaludis]